MQEMEFCWRRRPRCPIQEPRFARALLIRTSSFRAQTDIHPSPRTVLQPLGDPRATRQTLPRALFQDGKENGITSSFNLDRGAFPEESGGRGREVPDDAEVDLCDGVLFG